MSAVMRVARLLAVSTIVGIAAIAATAVPAAANGKYCSSFVQMPSSLFRHRACVNITSTGVSHTHTVHYLGTGTASIYQSTTYYINDGSGSCPGNDTYTYSSNQYRTFSCSTARVVGYQYRTMGEIHRYPQVHRVMSPTGTA